MVHRVYREVCKAAGVPIIGMGGACSWRDVVEFMLAGATAVAMGTVLFVEPGAPTRAVDGLADYMRQHGNTALRDIIGQVQTAAVPT
jgi:dihydroorotate dehydrogenase (NAD+) catalytic subunit